jgi:hypothetical protein
MWGMTRSAAPLAYVFWHSAAAHAPEYERDLLAFHASLAANPPTGFVRSETFGLAGASWLGDGQSYEDWYLVNDWQAIGELNRQAVTRPHVTSHDLVAHQAGSGAGAIYGLHAGSDSTGLKVATWFAKPPGWSYDRLYTALEGTLGDGASLWRRQLVLGPAPEFCLRSDVAPSLPAGIDAEVISYRPLP